MRVALNIFFLLLCFSNVVEAQSFQILDVNQIFRPSIRLEYDQTLPQKITGTDDGWVTTSRVSTSALIPIAGDIGMSISLDIDKPRDLLNLKKHIKPKGYQVLLSTSLQYIRPQFSKYNDQANIINSNIGALALHYKGLGAMFYMANIGFSEDISFPKKTQVIYSAGIGYMKLVNLRKQVFYGAFFVPINNIPIPIPFFGMNKKINKKWRFTMVLPAQIGVAYKHNRKLRQYFDVGINGVRGGMPNLDDNLLSSTAINNPIDGRVSWTRTQLRFRTCLKYKVNRNFIAMAHAGVNSGSLMSVNKGDLTRTEYLSPTLFFNVSVNYLFTRSLTYNLLKELIEW